MLQIAKRQSQQYKQQVFLELFAGAGSMASHFSRLRFGVVTLDISHSPLEDLCLDAVQQTILGWIGAGVVQGVWLGKPCTTWSVAHTCPVVRTRKFILGVPGFMGSMLTRFRRATLPCMSPLASLMPAFASACLAVWRILGAINFSVLLPSFSFVRTQVSPTTSQTIANMVPRAGKPLVLLRGTISLKHPPGAVNFALVFAAARQSLTCVSQDTRRTASTTISCSMGSCLGAGPF